jgi:hypothetical protein
LGPLSIGPAQQAEGDFCAFMSERDMRASGSVLGTADASGHLLERSPARNRVPRRPRMSQESSAGSPGIDVCRDLDQFFLEMVQAVRRQRVYEATAGAATYVASLLADHARTDERETPFERPLSLILAEALDHVGLQRFERLRQIGDDVLYATGFFGEHFESRGIEQHYVEELGARAYATASRMFFTDRVRPGELFDELADRFPMFVALVHDVADTLNASTLTSHKKLLEVYEGWLRTGSAALADALARSGLVPLRGTPTLQ